MAIQQRWRITFGKGQGTQYISHLDLHTAWERVFRRAGIPLSYSQGFNPQAKIQLAAALPVGYRSRSEVMDVFLEQAMDADALRAAIEPALPNGLRLVAVEEVNLNEPSLQASLSRADYVVQVFGSVPPLPEIRRRIAELLAAGDWKQTRQRKGRAETIDLRPLVFGLTVDGETASPSDAVTLRMSVAVGQTANIRPETILEALALPSVETNIERTSLHFEFDSNRPHGYNNLS